MPRSGKRTKTVHCSFACARQPGARGDGASGLGGWRSAHGATQRALPRSRRAHRCTLCCSQRHGGACAAMSARCAPSTRGGDVRLSRARARSTCAAPPCVQTATTAARACAHGGAPRAQVTWCADEDKRDSCFASGRRLLHNDAACACDCLSRLRTARAIVAAVYSQEPCARGAVSAKALAVASHSESALAASWQCAS